MLIITSRLDAWRRLASARWDIDLSERDVAAAINSRPETIARLRTLDDDARLSFDVLRRLCGFFGIQTGQLLILHQHEQPPPSLPPADVQQIHWSTPPTWEQITQVQLTNRLPEILSRPEVRPADIAFAGGTYAPRVYAQRHGAGGVKTRLLAAICEKTGQGLSDVLPITFPPVEAAAEALPC